MPSTFVSIRIPSASFFPVLKDVCVYIYTYIWDKFCCLLAKSCLTLCHPMACSLPGSSVHGFLQARILKWVAIPSSRGSSLPGDWTFISCIDRQIPYHWATREAHGTYISTHRYEMYLTGALWYWGLMGGFLLVHPTIVLLPPKPWISLPLKLNKQYRDRIWKK